ncbi:phage shock protein PspC (stress-responsive transcriptional regulator) [Paenibacillus forsythiae]|uniref:Phage shock protein PspC (Stress-responsive transcriptional regulator) n=1 Tax=Paenibacillus forsythiae TaxID=365616 RepID=A0ABU3HB52_9BACL|nr:PspC domain-containing protein [Paenibacillus forsythiae]MDT3427955.1 phage shock protein PspC (stress-responsive transcriptional regulator) [Paenibacillus forsythiae]
MTRLYRSTRDKVLTGLTGGLAEAVGIDSTLLRILLLISIPFTGGAVIPVYFIAALIFPREQGPYPPYGFGPEMADGGYGANYRSEGGYGRRGCGSRGPFGHSGPFNPPGSRSFGRNDHYDRRYSKASGYSEQDSGLDDMMKDIEKKAMQKEIEELRRKLAQYEDKKGEV